MTRIEKTVFCDHCGVEITWSPIVIGSRHYCCQDCFDNLKCDCRPAADWEDEGRSNKPGLDLPGYLG